jgi:hypothetical protein
MQDSVLPSTAPLPHSQHKGIPAVCTATGILMSVSPHSQPWGSHVCLGASSVGMSVWGAVVLGSERRLFKGLQVQQPRELRSWLQRAGPAVETTKCLLRTCLPLPKGRMGGQTGMGPSMGQPEADPLSGDHLSQQLTVWRQTPPPLWASVSSIVKWEKMVSSPNGLW